MEKKLRTKDEIWDEETYFVSYNRNFDNAMTEWGNQEYERGVEHGEIKKKNHHI